MIHGFGAYPVDVEAKMATAHGTCYANIIGRALMGAREDNLIERLGEQEMGTVRYVNPQCQEVIVCADEGTIGVGTMLTPGGIALELGRQANNPSYEPRRHGEYTIFQRRRGANLPAVREIDYDPMTGIEVVLNRTGDWGDLVWLDALVLNDAEPCAEFPSV